jgi:hypothetical protein
MKVIVKEIDPADLLYRIVQRGYRDRRRGHPPKPRKRKVLTTETIRKRRIKESRRRKKLRRDRRRDGLCSTCGRSRPGEGYRMCDRCRYQQRGYNEKHAIKKLILASYG